LIFRSDEITAKGLLKFCVRLLKGELLNAKVMFCTANEIKSDVWLTVHRNSVWIRKTN